MHPASSVAAGDAENVLFKHFPCLGIVLGRRKIEHDKVNRIHLDAVAQHINDAAFGKLPLQAVQKLTLFLLGFE